MLVTPDTLNVEESPSSVDFYRSIANAVDSATGIGVVTFVEGNYLTQKRIAARETTVIWTIAPGTTADIAFEYANRFMQSASIVFNKPVKVHVVNQGFRGSIKKLVYNRQGVVIDSDITANPGPQDPDGQTKLFRHLEFELEARFLFLAKPLVVSHKATPCTEDGMPIGAVTSMISSIDLFNSAKEPGLRINLVDGVDIRFSRGIKANTFTNFIRLGAPSFVQFDRVRYFVSERELDGRLRELKCRVRGGVLASNEVRLELQEGSRITLTDTAFGFAAGNGFIECDFGTLEGSIGQGSTINLSPSNDQNPTSFLLNDSDIQVKELKIEITDGRATRLSFGNESSLTARIFNGSLALGGDSRVGLRASTLKLLFNSAKWETGKRPNVTGIVQIMDLSIQSGLLELNEETEVNLVDGKLLGTNLVFNSLRKPLITGKLSSASLTCAEGSRIGIPGSLALTTRAGAKIEAFDSLELVDGASFPIGVYTLRVPFETLVNHQTASLSFTKGDALVPVQRHRDGRTTSPLTAGGDVIMGQEASVRNASLTIDGGEGRFLSATVDLFDGKLLPPGPNGVQEFRAKWSGNLVKLTIPLQTPQDLNGFDWDNDGNNNDDARLYSVKLNIALDPSANGADTRSFGPTSLVLKGTRVETDVELKPQFLMHVPAGGGEYIDGDNPSAGTEGGPHPTSQEVFRDEFSISTVHLYLHPRIYTVKTKFRFAFDAAGLTIEASDLSVTPSIDEDNGWNRDGGDLLGIGAVVGFLLGGLPGAVIGGGAGDVANGKIDGMITGLIYKRIQEFRQSWRVQNTAI